MKIKLTSLKLIWQHLSKQERTRLWYLFSFGFVNAILETYSIFIVYMFMRVVQDPNLVHRYAKWLPYSLSTKHYTLIFGCAAILIYVVKGLLNFFNSNSITHYSEQIQVRMSNYLYSSYLGMPYVDFIKQNPPEVENIVRGCVQRYSDSVLSIISMMVDFVAILLIIIMLLMLNWQLLLVVSVFFAIVIKFFVMSTVKKSKSVGELFFTFSDKCAKTVYNSMFNYKMLKLTGMNESLIKQFAAEIQDVSMTNSKRVLLSNLPRIGLEVICFVALIFAVMLGVLFTNSPGYVISLATLFLFVLMKILPSMMKMSYALQGLAFSIPFIEKIPTYGSMNVEDLDNEQVLFTQNINLVNIGFWYLEENKILQNINLQINKGERVGIIGPSGVGKSTLQDIIIGLLTPKTGYLAIDGVRIDNQSLKSWRGKIGYIPQEIYLYNGTVAENIVLNREYDEEKIVQCLKKAHIYDFLLEKEGIHTLVGNNGVMLSGGQKQRIGIARALYTNPEVLVLDEATSALDQATEASIMEDIYQESTGQTLIIITHRLSTLSGCNKIFTISKDGIEVKDK